MPDEPERPNPAELQPEHRPERPNAAEPQPERPPDSAQGATAVGIEPPSGWSTSMAVPVVIIAIAVGLIAAIVLIARGDQDAGAEVLAGTTVDVDTLPVTVPYREVAGSIVIDVKLGDDSRTVPMIVDTGAPTIVSQEIAEVFADGVAGTVSTASADGQVITSDVVQLPRLAIGDALFSDAGAVVDAIEPGNPFYCLSDEGFIGASLMRTAVWQVDPTARTITIAGSTADLDHIDGAIRLDFTRASDTSPSPLFELRAAEGFLAFLLDTGSDGWLTVNPADLEGVGLALPGDAPASAVLATTAGGPVGTRVRWTAADLGFGQAGAASELRLPLATSELLPQGRGDAGTDLLRHFVLTIDWVEDALYLDPIDDAPAPPDPASVSLGWDEGYVIGAYLEGWPGNEDLELGAEVTRIDGQDVTRSPFDDFCTRLADADGPGTYELTVAGETPTIVEVTQVEGFFEP